MQRWVTPLLKRRCTSQRRYPGRSSGERIGDEEAQRLARGPLVIGRDALVAEADDLVPFRDRQRDHELHQPGPTPKPRRRHSLRTRRHGDPMIEIVAGAHVPDLPFVIVNRVGRHVYLTGIGELWDAQTLASLR